jgi:hypothetical protein
VTRSYLTPLSERLKNWSWGIILLLRLGYCPLIRCIQGKFALLLDITPWEDL